MKADQLIDNCLEILLAELHLVVHEEAVEDPDYHFVIGFLFGSPQYALYDDIDQFQVGALRA